MPFELLEPYLIEHRPGQLFAPERSRLRAAHDQLADALKISER